MLVIIGIQLPTVWANVTPNCKPSLILRICNRCQQVGCYLLQLDHYRTTASLSRFKETHYLRPLVAWEVHALFIATIIYLVAALMSSLSSDY